MNPRQILLAVCVGATVALTGLTGCHTGEGDRTAGRVMDDKNATKNVKRALANNSLYKFPDVNVQTYNGAVSLSGFVDTPEQRNSAAEIARHVDGVREVVNALAIKQPQPMSPTGYPTGQRIDAPVSPPNTNTNAPGAPVTTPENTPLANPNQNTPPANPNQNNPNQNQL